MRSSCTCELATNGVLIIDRLNLSSESLIAASEKRRRLSRNAFIQAKSYYVLVRSDYLIIYMAGYSAPFQF